jgi:hypothetical protein
MSGLNDVLCQIERACDYADHFGRTVVVDTREHSDRYFRDTFSKYFISLQENLVLDADRLWDRLEALDVQPAFLAGRIRASRPRYDVERAMFVDAETGQPVTFDFARDHPAALLVHHQAGGGVHSIRALGRLRLTADLVGTLKARLAVLGRRYAAVHIRDTDYRTRYQGVLETMPIVAEAPVFVGTDSAAALAHCRAVFGADRVVSFAALPADGSRLHVIADPADAYARNRDAILDLVMLALAADLHVFQLEPNSLASRFSGYSMLAANLRANPALIARLVGEADVAALWD